MLQVAAELEDHYECARQRAAAERDDAHSRVSQLEIQVMQQQLEQLRVESQLHEANTARRQLEDRVRHLEEDNAALQEAAEHHNAVGQKEHLQRINELT